MGVGLSFRIPPGKQSCTVINISIPDTSNGALIAVMYSLFLQYYAGSQFFAHLVVLSIL
jgi:hypothetical protein